MKHGVLQAIDAAVRLTDASRSLDRHRRKTLGNLLGCHHGTLGAELKGCQDCERFSCIPHSCRNRSCPRCQSAASFQWLEKQRASLMDTSYFHNVFTLPHLLNPIVRQNRAKCLALLFHAAAQTLATFAANNLKATLGMTFVLHTWGQTLCEHYHLHAIVTGGGLSLDGGRWVDASGKRLFAVKALSQVFRAKYLAGLKALHAAGELQFHGSAQALETPEAFAQLLAQNARKKWVVYSKRPFAGPEQVLKYLSLYTHRAGIGDRRILSVDEDARKVRFAYKDYANAGAPKKMRLELAEFLRRFCLHVLPPRFVKIRHYGILSSRNRKAKVELCRALIERIRPPKPQPEADPQQTVSTEAEQNNHDAQEKEPCCPWCGSFNLVDAGALKRGLCDKPPVQYRALSSA